MRSRVQTITPAKAAEMLEANTTNRPLSRAAVAVGCAAIFMETHQDPDHAPSDGPNMLKLADLPLLLAELAAIDRIAKARKV